MTDPIKCLGMKCLFVAAAMFVVGCERNSSKTGTGPPSKSSSKDTKEQTTVTPILLPTTLFDDHEAFTFEVTGLPAFFTLGAHWTSDPGGVGLSDETLIYSAKVPREFDKGSESEGAGTLVVLIPEKPTGTIELHFRRGKTVGSKQVNTLERILPEASSDMRATGSGFTSGGKSVSIQFGSEGYKQIFMHNEKFESDNDTAFLTYRLTATPTESKPQNSAR